MKKVAAKQPDNIYELHDSEKARALYSDWAKRYDDDLLNEFGWRGHLAVAAQVGLLVADKSANILDAGCGTGFCGAALQAQGFTALTGMDLTQDMIDIAASKNIYAQLQIADLTEPLPMTAAFDVVCSAGVFSHGPLLPAHFGALLKPLRADGYAVHTINGLAFDKLGYASSLTELAQRRVVEFISEQAIDYNVKIGVAGRLVVCRKLAPR